MPDIATIRDTIRARLAELDQQIESLRVEAGHLERMLTATPDREARAPLPRDRGSAAVDATITKARRRPPGTAAGRTPAVTRGRPSGGGNRAKQALAMIGAQPGITASELAKAMGIAANYLYRVLPRLEREGAISKRGKGYHSAGQTDPAGAAPAASADA